MNWRRGVLLAGINLAAALPMIYLLAARDAQFLRERQQKTEVSQKVQVRPATLDRRNAADLMRTQEEQTVAFSPCGLWGHYPVQTYVVQFGDLPAFIATQWRVACPPRWSVAAKLGVEADGWNSEANIKAMRRVDVALCVLIVIQWFLIGSFPLIQPKRWWGEPGAFITVCTAIAALIALIPAVDGLAKLPAVIAFFAWLWWLGLLIWKPVHLAWQSTVGGLRRLSN
jgi:hypothetical protein